MKNRSGISLIEVMVAVTLLGMIATVHTIVTLRYAVRNRAAAIGVSRAAAVNNAVDLFTTMPYANLGTNTGCVTLSVPADYPHQRCVTATALTSNITRMQIIIQPTNTAFKRDTANVDRAAPPQGSLFQ